MTPHEESRGTFGPPGSRFEDHVRCGPWRRVFPLAATVLSCLGGIGCGPSSEEAAAAIQSHLQALAPSGLQQDRWEEVTVDVLDLAADSSGVYTATFQAFNPRFVHGSNDTMRGPTYEVELARGEGGFEVTRYGEELGRTVAVLVAADRRTRYAPLLEELSELMDSTRATLRAWARPLKQQFVQSVNSGSPADAVERLDDGIPPHMLEEGLSARGWGSRKELVWGVAASEEPGTGAVVWLSPAEEADVVCARLVGTRPPADWNWLDGQFPTCKGRGGRYVERYPPEDVLAEIRASGGRLEPASSAPR